MSQEKIQEKLAEARKLLVEVGKLADESGETDIQFMGLVYERSVGWFSPDGEFQESSEWNYSDCVIGSEFERDYGMEGWKRIPGRKQGDGYP